MSILSILGLGNNKIRQALRNGAVIIDVRTALEFDEGKVRGSINIPVDRISANVERIRDMRKPIIICSDGDVRADQSATILKANGIKEVYNAGSWMRLLKMVKSL